MSSTRRERSVKVWVSAGPRATIVPALLGESERTAQLRLQQDGLELGGIAEIRSGDYPADASSRRRRRQRAGGARVALLVNRGERGATYVMPDLIGVNGDRAADLLARAVSASRSSAIIPIPACPPGIVLRQSPQAGFQIAPGRADLARGQPVKRPDRPVDPVGGFRRARRRRSQRWSAAAPT